MQDLQPGPIGALWIPPMQIGVPIPPSIHYPFRINICQTMRPIKIILSADVYGTYTSSTASWIGQKTLPPPHDKHEMLSAPLVRTHYNHGSHKKWTPLWLSDKSRPEEGHFRFELAISPELPLV